MEITRDYNQDLTTIDVNAYEAAVIAEALYHYGVTQGQNTALQMTDKIDNAYRYNRAEMETQNDN